MRFLTIKAVYGYFVLLFLISISFSKVLPNIVLGCMSGLFIYTQFKNNSLSIPRYYFTSFGILLLYLIIKQTINGTVIQEIDFYGRFALVVLVPILLLHVSRYQIMFGILLSTIVALILALFKIISYYATYKIIPFSNVSQVNELLPLERPYMGFLCVISSILCLYLAQKFARYKYLLIIFSVVNIGFVFLISARLSIITLVLLLVVYVFAYSDLSNIKKVMIVAASVLAVVILLFSYSNLYKRFFVGANFETMVDYEPRVEIWSCNFKIINEQSFNHLIGLDSNETLENKLTDCYGSQIKNESKKQYFLELKFNTHNQFLHLYLIGGIIGLVLFLYFCTLLIIHSKENFFMFAIAIALVVFLFLENVLHRQYGCYYTALIFTLIIKNKNEES